MPRDGAGVSVMPLGTAAAKSVSIFDDESEDRDHEFDRKKLASRGTSCFFSCRLLHYALSHSCCAVPALLPPKKYENLFQEEHDVDDL
jgi:hypothetical protein